MAPIYIMAIITTVVAAGLWVFLGALMAGRHRWAAWVLVLTLPFSALINLLVKRPLMQGVAQTLGPLNPDGPPPLFWAITLFMAPVTEEAIKALPALLPPLLRRIRANAAALWVGLFLGIGFGLGEIWFLAWNIARAPQYADIPWWLFTGFLNERALVVIMHGIMTAVVVSGIARGVLRGWLGYLYAIALHALTNLGALLLQMKLLPAAVAGTWIFIPLILLIIIFMRMYQANLRIDKPDETVLYQRSAP